MVGIRFGGGPDEILTSCIITPPLALVYPRHRENPNKLIQNTYSLPVFEVLTFLSDIVWFAHF